MKTQVTFSIQSRVNWLSHIFFNSLIKVIYEEETGAENLHIIEIFLYITLEVIAIGKSTSVREGIQFLSIK